ncbi:MAG: aspartate kinase [Bacteroidia bacterium]|nr:aspartate kinase [Bacteroidia bacterium]
MKVLKFGGASVKDAGSVKNVARILKLFPDENLIVVISAMGKTTNSLERLSNAYYYKKGNPRQILDEIKKFHIDIVEGLFPDKTHPIYNEINNTFVELDWAIEGEPAPSFDQQYDQIVSMGEVISTKIISAYLNESGIKNKWEDIRDFIKTDNTYREGKVDWKKTQQLSQALSKTKGLVITQGFIGGTSENYTTTLGREGSDYTAAILAYCTNAESVTIWKDVPGVLNADPKWFDDTHLIEQLSYLDAIELSYYGATVIHPKTIKPLQNKQIPLYVRSFIKPDEKGTVINDKESPLPIPCFIFKVGQVLLSISPKDFSFIVEQNLSDIFKLFADMGIKINTMQSSAISFSVCVDIDEHKVPNLVKKLQEKYRVLYNEGMELVTIRYYNQETIDRVTTGKKILLEVKSRYTVQLVVKNI